MKKKNQLKCGIVMTSGFCYLNLMGKFDLIHCPHFPRAFESCTSRGRPLGLGGWLQLLYWGVIVKVETNTDSSGFRKRSLSCLNRSLCIRSLVGLTRAVTYFGV